MTVFFKVLLAIHEPEETREIRNVWAMRLIALSIFLVGCHAYVAFAPYFQYQERIMLYMPEMEFFLPFCTLFAGGCDGMMILYLIYLYLGFRWLEWPLMDLYTYRTGVFTTCLLSSLLTTMWISMYLVQEPMVRRCGIGFHEFSCKPESNRLVRVNCNLPDNDEGVLPKDILQKKTQQPHKFYDCYFIKETWTKYELIESNKGHFCDNWTYIRPSKCLCEKLPDSFTDKPKVGVSDVILGDTTATVKHGYFRDPIPEDRFLACDRFMDVEWPWVVYLCDIFHGHYLILLAIIYAVFVEVPGYFAYNILPAVSNDVFIKLISVPVVAEVSTTLTFALGFLHPMWKQGEHAEIVRILLLVYICIIAFMIWFKFMYLIYFFSIYWEHEYGTHHQFGNLHTDRLRAANLTGWELLMFVTQTVPTVLISLTLFAIDGFPSQKNYHCTGKNTGCIPLLMEQVLVTACLVIVFGRFFVFIKYRHELAQEDEVIGVARYQKRTAPPPLALENGPSSPAAGMRTPSNWGRDGPGSPLALTNVAEPAARGRKLSFNSTFAATKIKIHRPAQDFGKANQDFVMTKR